MNSIENKVISILQTLLNTNEITTCTSLIENDMIDSIGIANLIIEIEKEYNIDLTEEDFVIENFNTPKDIASMILKRLHN